VQCEDATEKSLQSKEEASTRHSSIAKRRRTRSILQQITEGLEEGSPENTIDQAVERLNTAIQNAAKAALSS
jgi:hypothetical protein